MDFYHKKNKVLGGFTLTEMLVSIAILSILISVFLGSRAQHTDRLALKNETYKAMLYVRQAQVYSLAVRSAGNNTFDTSYGVYFDTSLTDQFKFFTDSNKNTRYDVGENVEIIYLQNGIRIRQVCLEGTAPSSCFPIGSGQVRKAGISFIRPESLAVVKGFNNSDNVIPPLTAPAYIVFESAAGLTSTIKIDSSGVIAVQGI